MKNEDANISDEAERYLQGLMSVEERLDFENRTKSDPFVSKILEKQRAINALMVEAGLAEIRSMLQIDLAKNNTKNNKRNWLGGVFLILVLSGVGYYYIEQNLLKVNSSIVADSIGKREINRNEEEDTNYTKRMIEKPEPSVFENEKTVIEENNSANIFVNENEEKGEKLEQVVLNQNPLAVTRNQENELKETNLIVKDKTDIKVHDNGILKKINCNPLEKETFSPSSENAYQLLFEKTELSEIIIYDKKMQEIRIFKSGDVLDWDGRNKDGQMVETGLYKIEVRYSNGEICLFNLTVFN